MMQTTRDRIVNKVGDLVTLGRFRVNQLRHAGKTPALSPVGKRIVREIAREGVSIVSLDELRLGSTPEFERAIRGTCNELERLAGQNAEHDYDSGFQHCTPVNPTKIATDFPGLYAWGLDEGLLDIVENVLGLPPAYHGVCARQEIVDGRDTGTRLWHRDTEDVDIIRVLVYMNDVLDDAAGPFEYVPVAETPTYRDFRGVDSITDEHMRQVVPDQRWRRCYGPAGTVIFGAVARIFHHGKLPRRPRQVCSFYYTSRAPANEELCREYSFQSGMSSLELELTERQRACLWEYERLLADG